jgi:hypothetical protein
MLPSTADGRAQAMAVTLLFMNFGPLGMFENILENDHENGKCWGAILLKVP